MASIMSKLSPDVAEKARKIRSVIFKQFAEIGQGQIARAIGVSDTWMSNRKEDEHFDHFCAALAAGGLKVVPESVKCYPADQLTALIQFAKIGMRHVREPADLLWEDAE